MRSPTNLVRTCIAASIAGLVLTSLAGAANLNAPDRWWALNEGQGMEIADSSRNHISGKLVNMNQKAWTRGISKSALVFDGKDDYVDIYDATSPEPGYYGSADGDFTLVFWVALLSNKQMSLMRRSSESAAWWSCPRSLRVTKAGDGPMRFEAYVWDGTNERAIGTTELKTRTWYHVAMVCDVGGGKTGLRLFVNGALEASAWNGAGQGGHNNWFIGRENSKPSSGGGSFGYLHGIIDDVRVYNTPLTNREVAALHAGTRRGQARHKITVESIEDEAAESEDKPEAVPAEEKKAPAQKENVLPNGGFELEDRETSFASGWRPHRWGEGQSRSSIRMDRVNFHSGKSSVAVKSMGEGVKPGIFATLKLEPGKYELVYWATADVDEGETASVSCHVAGEDFGPSPVRAEWKEYRHTLLIRDKMMSGSVRLWTESAGARVWFDDVELMRLP